MHDKAFIVSKFWAGIFSSIIATSFIGGLAYAWSANAQIAVMQRDINNITDAKLDMRLTRMEEKIDMLITDRRRR